MPYALFSAGSVTTAKSGLRPSTTSSSITYLLPLGWSGSSYMMSSHHLLDDRPQAAGAGVLVPGPCRRSRAGRRSENSSSQSSISNSFWYCLTQGVLRLGQDADQARRDRAASSDEITGRRPTNSGIMPNSIRSSVCDLRQQLGQVLLVLGAAGRAEADRLACRAACG